MPLRVDPARVAVDPVVAAQAFAAEHGVWDGVGRADIAAAVTAVGGRFEVRADAGLRTVFVTIAADKTFTVYLPPSTSPQRDRFTAAQAVGHLVMHHHGGDASFYRYANDSRWRRSNRFAAELLMPSPFFEDEHLFAAGDLRRVAEHFDVTVAAVHARAAAMLAADRT